MPARGNKTPAKAKAEKSDTKTKDQTPKGKAKDAEGAPVDEKVLRSEITSFLSELGLDKARPTDLGDDSFQDDDEGWSKPSKSKAATKSDNAPLDKMAVAEPKNKGNKFAEKPKEASKVTAETPKGKVTPAKGKADTKTDTPAKGNKTADKTATKQGATETTAASARVKGNKVADKAATAKPQGKAEAQGKKAEAPESAEATSRTPAAWSFKVLAEGGGSGPLLLTKEPMHKWYQSLDALVTIPDAAPKKGSSEQDGAKEAEAKRLDAVALLQNQVSLLTVTNQPSCIDEIFLGVLA